jgi:helicase
LKVEELNVDERIKLVVKERGIGELWPPQVSAIEAGLLEGTSLVVAASTSSGKTLIAELLMANTLLERGGKAIYLVPLRALATQKLEEFQAWQKAGLKVASSTGDYDEYDKWLSAYDIVILTYEKCDSLLRKVERAEWLKRVSVVIADEIHLLGDKQRGSTLEMVLTRLRILNPQAVFLGLSATIGNPEDIAKWLNARIIRSPWRPVPLRQGVLFDETVYYEDGREEHIDGVGTDPVTGITLSYITEGGQAIVFASTRKQAVALAKKFAGKIALTSDERRELQLLSKEVAHSDEGSQTVTELSALMRQGVGFHHAGLSFEARRALETGFKRRLVKVLASTTTLAAGMNLPARLVVIHELTRFESGFGRQRIPVMEYHQMAGRAGRPGFDKEGRAILIARHRSEVSEFLEDYIRARPEIIEPALSDERALLPHVLSTIAGRYANSREEVARLFGSTFSGTLISDQFMVKILSRSLGELIEMGFVNDGAKLFPTRLGRATSELYLHPYTAILIQNITRRLKETSSHALLLSICLTNEVVKPHLTREEREKYAYEFYQGDSFIEPEDLELAMPDQEFETTVLEAYKASKILEDWIAESTEGQIEEKHRVQPGDLYQLYTSAAWIARSASKLVRITEGDKDVASQFETLSLRIESGVREELVELVRLRNIGRVRARLLYRAGIRSLKDVASTPVKRLSRIKGIPPSVAAEIRREAFELTSE